MIRNATDQLVELMAEVLSGPWSPIGQDSDAAKQIRKLLRDIEEERAKRYEVQRQRVLASLHPTGCCSCGGEGTCSWCALHNT